MDLVGLNRQLDIDCGVPGGVLHVKERAAGQPFQGGTMSLCEWGSECCQVESREVWRRQGVRAMSDLHREVG